jgi:hypothetical protein
MATMLDGLGPAATNLMPGKPMGFSAERRSAPATEETLRHEPAVG